MRSFDPRSVGALECRAWETYYRRKWAPFPDNKPAAARALMTRFYRLLAASENGTWLWGMGVDEKRRIRATSNLVELRQLRLPRGRGPIYGWLAPLAARVPVIRDQFLSIMVAEFATGDCTRNHVAIVEPCPSR